MVDAVVLVDFAEDGTVHRKGERLTLSQTDYDRLAKKGWIGPTSEPGRQDV